MYENKVYINNKEKTKENTSMNVAACRNRGKSDNQHSRQSYLQVSNKCRNNLSLKLLIVFVVLISSERKIVLT